MYDLVRNATPSLTFGLSRLRSVNYSWKGFSAVPLRNVVLFSLSTSVFRPPKYGLVTWLTLNGLVSFPVMVLVLVI